jgi:hypothetical protein
MVSSGQWAPPTCIFVREGIQAPFSQLPFLTLDTAAFLNIGYRSSVVMRGARILFWWGSIASFIWPSSPPH